MCSNDAARRRLWDRYRSSSSSTRRWISIASTSCGCSGLRHPFRFDGEHGGEIAAGEHRREAQAVGHGDGLRRAAGDFDSLRKRAIGCAPRAIEGEVLGEMRQARARAADRIASRRRSTPSTRSGAIRGSGCTTTRRAVGEAAPLDGNRGSPSSRDEACRITGRRLCALARM